MYIYIYTYTHTYTHIYTHIFHIYIRAYSSCFMHVVVTCMRLPFFSIYFQISYIFAKIFKYVALFCPFSEKLHACPQLSRIGPVYIYIYRESFFTFRFTPCKDEQTLQGMQLQDK